MSLSQQHQQKQQQQQQLEQHQSPSESSQEQQQQHLAPGKPALPPKPANAPPTPSTTAPTSSSLAPPSVVSAVSKPVTPPRLKGEQLVNDANDSEQLIVKRWEDLRPHTKIISLRKILYRLAISIFLVYFFFNILRNT